MTKRCPKFAAPFSICPPPCAPPKFCKKHCKNDYETVLCKDACSEKDNLTIKRLKKCKKKCRKKCIGTCKGPGGALEKQCSANGSSPPSSPSTAIPVTSDVTSADGGSSDFTYELIGGGVASVVALLALLVLANRRVLQKCSPCPA